MDVHQGRGAILPIRRDLAWTVASSFAIAILIAAASVAGIAYRGAVYPTDELARTFVSNDVVSLLVGLPLLLGSTAQAWRGRRIGLLAWPGALLFVLYNYMGYVFAVPLSAAYLLHLALVVLSAVTLVGLVAAIDGKSVQRALAGNVREQVAAVILVGLGLLFFLRSAGVIAGVVAGAASVAVADLAVNIADFLISPAWILGGVSLWRRKELGYVLGLGLLLGLSLLFIALVVFLLLQPVLTASPFAPLDVVVVLAMGLVCFVPCLLFARGVASSHRVVPA